MFHTRKLSCLMLIVLLGLCSVVFAQVVVKKPPVIPVPVVVQCPVCPKGTQPSTVFTLNFNDLTTSDYIIQPPSPSNPTQLGLPPNFGKYAITDNPKAFNSNWITNNALPPNQGKILVCDGFKAGKTKLFGKIQNTQLVPGEDYIFCARFKNIYPATPKTGNPTVQLKIEIPSSSSGGTTSTSNQLTLSPGADWQSLFLPWTCPGGCTQATLEIWLLEPTRIDGIGNDIGVDDISFVECKPIQMCDCRCERTVKISYWTPGGLLTGEVVCGGSFNVGDVCLCNNISLIGKCTCAPDGCKPTYKWEITGPNTYHLGGTYTATPCNISFIPTQPGSYSIVITPKCGDIKCPQCTINVVIKGIVLCKNSSQEHPPTTEADKAQ